MLEEDPNKRPDFVELLEIITKIIENKPAILKKPDDITKYCQKIIREKEQKNCENENGIKKLILFLQSMAMMLMWYHAPLLITRSGRR